MRCSVSTADDRVHASRTMYVYATPVPKGSYTDYLTKTLFDGAKVKLEDPVKHAGGTIYAYCLTPTADVKGGCGADWVAGDGSVVFGLQLSGGDVTAKQVTAALQHELATIVERFGSDATTSSTPSTDRPARPARPARPIHRGPPTRPSRKVAAMSNLPPPDSRRCRLPARAADHGVQPVAADQRAGAEEEVEAPLRHHRRRGGRRRRPRRRRPPRVRGRRRRRQGGQRSRPAGRSRMSPTPPRSTRARTPRLLTKCPFDGLDELADDAPKGFDAAGAADGDDQALVTQIDAEGGPAAAAVLDRHRRPVARLRGRHRGAAADRPAGLHQPLAHRRDGQVRGHHVVPGGTLLPFCTEPKEGSDVKVPLCATVWYDKQLLHGDLHPWRRQFDRRHHGVGEDGSRRL